MVPVYESFSLPSPIINIFNIVIMQIGDNSEIDAKSLGSVVLASHMKFWDNEGQGSETVVPSCFADPL